MKLRSFLPVIALSLSAANAYASAHKCLPKFTVISAAAVATSATTIVAASTPNTSAAVTTTNDVQNSTTTTTTSPVITTTTNLVVATTTTVTPAITTTNLVATTSTTLTDAVPAPVTTADVVPSITETTTTTTFAALIPATTTAVSTGSGSCSNPSITVTNINVGESINVNEDDAGSSIISISSIPSGGSRIAYATTGGTIKVVTLNADDTINTSVATVTVDVVDFADLYADDTGFVILGTRDAEGGGTLNCGNPSNLCGTAPNPAIPCYDMYLIRFDGSTEIWATKLTSSSASLPPYSTSSTGPEVYMIWWYAHQGQIAFDGANWGAYFGAAISVSQGGCINIHQGDRMKVVGPLGEIVSSVDSFDWGCSHSGYERLVYDARVGHFVMICKTDNNDQLMFPDTYNTIYPVDLWYSDLGGIALDSGSGGYWASVSNIHAGQPADASGNADVHLIHFTKTAVASGVDADIVLAAGSVTTNARAPHIAALGSDASSILVAWETATSAGELQQGNTGRVLWVQVVSATDGSAVSNPVTVSAAGNRYSFFKTAHDGSVAYPAQALDSDSAINVVRVASC
ncbi:hypothetical protein HK100_001779 [Physocladia obscura]|uniref:Uncharacterized protein n=1 Tax=Physocladia obscura TaxID=109957 RepID=A0AAD5SWC8_9FUNG|nr:hypothetical protein HK100_001779 [Physocladia obscura]